MQGSIPRARQKIIRRIAALARRPSTPPPRDLLASLTPRYLHGVAEEELALRPPAAWLAMLRGHLAFGRRRPRGRALIRVFNADARNDGFDSPHTLVLVVTDDMPFLVDSVTMTFAATGAGLHLVVHPVLGVQRDAAGRLRAFTDVPARASGVRAESWQLYEIDRIADPAGRTALENKLARVLQHVRAATSDWRAMTKRALEAATHLESTALRTPRDEAREAAELLRWMVNEHFTFLGYRQYRIRRQGRREMLAPVPATGLGVLRAHEGHAPATPLPLTGAVRRFARSPAPILIAKGNSVSTVHRATHFDYIGAKIFDGRGRTLGEHRFIGLWTSSAYHMSPKDIPVLRRKREQILRHFGLDPASHDGKAVLNVIETYPRDELFQTPPGELVNTVRGIVNLYERSRTRLFLRRDPFGRFYSCLLYLPRDRYNTDVRRRVEKLLCDTLKGLQAESQVQLSESAMARVHVLVRTDPADAVHVGEAQLERLVAGATRGWPDDLKAALLARHEEATALQLHDRYAARFPAAYRADVPAAEAVDDIAVLQALPPGTTEPGMRILCRGAPRGRLSFRLFRRGTAISVSDVMPTLENLGFRLLSEHPYALAAPDEPMWIQDFALEGTTGKPVDLVRDAARIEATFQAVWRGETDNDGFNRLVVAAGLDWRGAAMLRVYGRWLMQVGVPFSQKYLEDTLVSHAGATRALAAQFAAQFEPLPGARARARLLVRHRRAFAHHLAQVSRQDEDRILRAFHHAIEATVRTNHFQRDAAGAPKSWLSVKIATRGVPEVPQPRPLYEIFVHSPRVEGIHLRMGHVARGGIRWSERREDFRTEVLGLMKAQNVKNTLIVPVGAKGGFVPRRPPVTRDEIRRDGIECYQIFIRALLDLTDNIAGGVVVAPVRVIRRDGDDPYLVVAADKGTATFSDIANAISLERGYWLGDAFASGGSAGYDHKRMGITARGAWECVKRHFRELGLDTQRQDFDVVGIGDMSGDVFGNGMLQSPHIRLVAAFNHQHIFLDPEPDAARSFRERERLFRLSSSSWDDYDRRLISRGGGVFARQSKRIALTAQARRLLGLGVRSATPQEIIRRILCLPVDLLWNGGIGTYVKATGEANTEIGDRANDALRVNGADLRCRVVAEGGNLGCSQRGRIEYAARGGCINTDFIDNSAGVNCSDVEVNIKIGLNAALEERRLERAARDRLLVRMKDDVAALVLRNNYLQSQAISVLQASAAERFGEHAQLVALLERSGGLDRRLEFLPDDEELAERRRSGSGFTRPELAMLLSWSKIWINERLIQSDVPEDAYLGHELERYFPAPMRRRFAREIAGHRLRREIIATATTNSLVNRMGPAFVPRAAEDTGASAGAVARAYTIAREITDMRALWIGIEGLDNSLPAARQYAIMHETSRVLVHLSYWILARRGRLLDIERSVDEFGPGMRQFLAQTPARLAGIEAARVAEKLRQLEADGVPGPLAGAVAALSLAQSGIDVVDLARRTQVKVRHAAEIYLQLGLATGLDWVRQQIDALAVDGHFQSLARGTLREEAYALQRQLCAQLLQQSRGVTSAAALERWQNQRSGALQALARSQAQMRAGVADFPTLSVALQVVRRLTAH